jgi:FkbM family methyltransferase
MSQPIQSLIVTLVDGSRVAVPADITKLTTYVLLEQRDWFESELPFLRKLIQPGDHIVDVGASYGCYCLSLANRVGPTGRVYAFEPNPEVSCFLEESVRVNAFNNIVVDHRGVSGGTGSMFMHPHVHSECRGLSNEASGEGEAIPTASLDELMAEYSWKKVDFLKIDVEGLERPVLFGGLNMLRELSPLVLYEVQHSVDSTDHDLPRLFAEHGLHRYQLIPSLNLLVPVEAGKPISPFVINLFGADERRTEILRKAGRLLTAEEMHSTEATEIRRNLPSSPTIDFDRFCQAYPFARGFAEVWSQSANRLDSRVTLAISLYHLSRDESRPPLERWIKLSEAEQVLRSLVETLPTPCRLATLSRIQFDLGDRFIALNSLNKAWQARANGTLVSYDELFLPCAARFDSIVPHSGADIWFQAMMAEASELWGNFSSYFDHRASTNRLNFLRDAGYLSEDFARRLELLQQIKPVEQAAV